MNSNLRHGNEHPPRLSRDQIKAYQQTTARLRQAHFDAAQLVIALVRMHADPEQARWLCCKLEAVVVSMNFLIRDCEQIAGHDFEPSCPRVEFIVHAPCGCRARTEEPKVCDEGDSSAVPVADPGWSRELEALLVATETAIHYLGEATGFSAHSTRSALASLAKLWKMLLRERQHLNMMEMTPPKPAWLVEQRCVSCGRELSGSKQDRSAGVGPGVNSCKKEE